MCRALFIANVTLLYSSRGRCFTSRVIVAHSITSSGPHIARQSSFHPLLPFLLAHRQITLPPSRRLRCSESSWSPLELSFAHIAIKSSATLPLRPLHQTGAPTGHFRPIQLRSTPHIYRFAVSYGRADVRRIDSWELDCRMCSRIGLKRRHVRYTVRMDLMVGVHHRSWIRKSHSGGRADKE